MMKTIKEYLQSGHTHDGDGEIKKPNVNSKELAYDYNGTPWTVKAYSYLDNHESVACGGMNTLLEKYDQSGSAADDLELIKNDCTTEELHETIYVGVQDTNGHKAVYVWGPEGVCYENKKLV